MLSRTTLSLLSLSRASALRLSAWALREPSSGSTIEPACLRGCTTTTLRATRTTRTDTTYILRACAALHIGFEWRLRRRSCSAGAETLLVLLVRIQRFSIVCRTAGEHANADTDAAEAAAQLVRMGMCVWVVA